MTTNEETQYLTPKDVEKILNVSQSTASRLLNRPDMPVIRIGRCVRVKKDDFEAFMQAYKNNRVYLSPA